MSGMSINGELAAPSQAVTQLSTLLLPVSDHLLVLPNVTVAEIIPFREPIPADDVPTWFLGFFEWRSSRVPLISFEAINDEPFAGRGRNRRIAVLNNVTGDTGMPFCGLLTNGLPRLMRLTAEDIVDDSDTAPGPAELARVYINGERASVPNVSWILQQVIHLI